MGVWVNGKVGGLLVGGWVDGVVAGLFDALAGCLWVGKLVNGLVCSWFGWLVNWSVGILVALLLFSWLFGGMVEWVTP